MKFEVDGELPGSKRRPNPDELAFILERVPLLYVDCVIVRQGGVLLARQTIGPFRGYWSLPSDMILCQETPHETFVRIFHDELGLTCTEKTEVGHIVSRKDPLQIVSLAFLVTKFEGEPRDMDQSRNPTFFKELPKKTQPYQAEFLKKKWRTITA